jgi:hypothetical protein
MIKDTAYSTVLNDEEVMIPAANAKENDRPPSSTSPPSPGLGSGGLICVMFCMIVLLIAILYWAVSVTFYFIDLTARFEFVEGGLFATQIYFAVTHTVSFVPCSA